MRKSWPVFLLLISVATQLQAATLIGWAQMPADTFTPGPTSGQFIEAKNGKLPPFVDRQPVQGFSALLAADQGSFFALTDNGFGARDNSADYLLGWYRIRPHFRRADALAKNTVKHEIDGTIVVEEITRLSDPSSLLDFKLSRESDRLLTGADLDPESFRLTPDGSFWIGDEFLPALLQFNSRGELLAAPFTLPGLASKGNPMGEVASLRSSRGFEGLGQSRDGLWLYPMLEGAMLSAEPGLNIYTFDVTKQKFVNTDASQPSYRYQLSAGSTAVGDFTMFSDSGGLMIERDSLQGSEAVSKKIYKIDFKQVGADGFLIKTLVADLLEIEDPFDLDQDGSNSFSFPFWTIEGLVVVNATTLAIANDNNYPFDNARSKTAPDNTEFILLEVAPLWD